MATVVAAAVRLARHAGLVGTAEPIDPMGEPIFYKLMLTPDQVVGLIEHAEHLASAISGE